MGAPCAPRIAPSAIANQMNSFMNGKAGGRSHLKRRGTVHHGQGGRIRSVRSRVAMERGRQAGRRGRPAPGGREGQERKRADSGRWQHEAPGRPRETAWVEDEDQHGRQTRPTRGTTSRREAEPQQAQDVWSDQGQGHGSDAGARRVNGGTEPLVDPGKQRGWETRNYARRYAEAQGGPPVRPTDHPAN